MRRPAILLALAICASAAPTSHASAQAGEVGFRDEFLREWDERREKYVSLAEAMPAELYDWRPAEGVRSVAEVFMHMAAANYNLARRLDVEPPAGFAVQGYETSSSAKADVVAALRDSFAHLRRGAEALEPADETRTMPWFGGSEITMRGFLLFLTGHAGEHLGQSIAYARTNGVVPPWSSGSP
ncbi:MAG: DinB family protein [Longimicrobiales bacterium]